CHGALRVRRLVLNVSNYLFGLAECSKDQFSLSNFHGRNAAAASIRNWSRSSWRGCQVAAVSFVLVVGSRTVPTFPFCLFLVCSHGIQSRLIEQDLECIIPAQIRVLFELRADLIFEVLGDLDFTRFELALQFLELFAQLVAAMECLIRLAEQLIVRDDLFEAVLLQLALDHCNQLIAGHGVKLNAL